LKFNLEHKLFFFRITSDLVPFASHPINTFDWQNYFKKDFELIGEFILNKKMRISMHPDQFTLINSISDEIFERSSRELQYHADILNLMNLDESAKVQIHVGGVYGNKKNSMDRFVARFHMLGKSIRQRLVIENDDRLYDINDCLELNLQAKIPVLFDFFHHKLNNSEKTPKDYFELLSMTWNEKKDGLPMVDYSSQKAQGFPRQHSETIDLEDFAVFLKQTEPFDFDIMLEIKNKEKSAIKAINFAINDVRVRNFFSSKQLKFSQSE
jgi:UV DNA damage endonuclease